MLDSFTKLRQLRYVKRTSLRLSVEEAGGKFLARGGKTIPMHGTPPAPRVVIVQFDSLDKAQAWANSPAAKAAFAIGAKYATLTPFMEGAENPRAIGWSANMLDDFPDGRINAGASSR
jgi:uncharacterized protein (DUF1330 family)